MEANQFDLLRRRRFAPLFVTQFLGAMNDNLFKQALIVLIVFRLAQQIDINGQILVTLAAGIFIAPFFLFSATAGQLADKLDKARAIRWIKAGEIVIMSLAGMGFLIGDAYFLLGVLFLMGTQSAFFGPLKYGILPDHLAPDELIGGNGLIEGATFIAILIGTMAGGLIILTGSGTEVVSITVLGLAGLGWLASGFIPAAPSAAPDLRINPNFLGEAWNIVRFASATRSVFLSILGISWFWLVGATFLAQFPAFTKDLLGADETVVTLFMGIFSVGIAIGSLLCNRLLKNRISAKYVPFGALGLSLFTADLYFATRGLGATGGALIGAGAFIGELGNWRIMGDLLAISICGGLYSVPLYAILQNDSQAGHKSRTIAANNILNALFMVVGALGASVLLGAGARIPELFGLLAILNAGVALYITRLLPDAVIKAAFAFVLKLLYRVKVRGLENYAKAGPRAVIVVNHVSFLDALLLAVFLPVKPIFAIDTLIAGRWWMAPFRPLVHLFPMDPGNPMAIKSLIRRVQADAHCVIFPEGRITVTGGLMKIHEGPGMIADKSDAMLVPVRIEGAQYTIFSRLRGKLRRRPFPKITLSILEPRKFRIPDGLVGRKRRQIAGLHLYDVMSEMMLETCDKGRTLFEALLDARKIHGGAHPAIEDMEREPLSYARLIRAALVLGRCLARLTGRGEYVGVLLPNSTAAAATFFALQAQGRVPAMLNFSTGDANMLSALEAGPITRVLTSRRFIEAAKLGATVEALGQKASIHYLEDLRDEISLGDKLQGLIASLWPGRAARNSGAGPDDAAVVLFTSGSEGTPKGVVLSHRNLLANRYQLGARIDFNPTDIVFNALPIFHSFGLTGGLLLPILSGVKTFLYPSPLHYRIVPALVYDSSATIMFGTDTFLAGYGRLAHAYDFYSLRYIFAGAERVRDETRRSYADKFGIRILEGYGTTETAPVLAANTPMHCRAGTVGRFLPGITHRLEPVEGIERGGRLVVAGPNVMKGYLRASAPGVLDPPVGGLYDTGDIVALDDEGYVTILGRAKRFAKIAGEMVSLSAIEAAAARLWPENLHAVISLPDARKGEQLVLFTERAGASPQEFHAHARAAGIAEIMVPKTVRVLDAIPLLGTGKVDYAALTQAAIDDG